MHNEAKNNIKISKKSLLISIISILAVFVVGTFAWFTWRSNETALVLTVGDIKNLNITLAPYKFNSSIVPSSSYNTNDYVQVKASNNSEDMSYSVGLFYRINSIDPELVSSDFQYTVEKSTDGSTYTSYKTGDFSTAQSGVDYPILTAEELSADTTCHYRVYIWIESNGDQSSMQGKIFDAELRANYISDSSSRPNAPVLDNNGMVPVTIANDGTVTTVSKNSSNWYNYDNKKWANAVLVKETGTKTRSYYLNNPNQTVNQDDILAYYVWIPRYKYRIFEGTCASVSNPTIFSHPDCYDPPYQMSDTNKSILIDAIYNYSNFIGENISKSDVTTAVNDGLTTGTFTLTVDGQTESLPILDLFSTSGVQQFSDGYEYEYTNSDDAEKLALALYDLVINDPYTDFEYSVDIAYEDIEFSRHLGVIFLLKSMPIMGFEEASTMYEEMTGEKIGYTKTPNISGTFKPNNVIESNKEKEIDIVFETASTDKSRGDATSTYYTHPAFTFGNDELSGIWVGKFETSASPDSDCFKSPTYDNCRNNNVEPRILPKVNALGIQYIGNQFMTALKFSGGSMNTSSGIVTFGGSTTFGLSDTTNSHMMKNSEWGAVAYLSHSKYGTCTNGTCTEIRINNYLDYTNYESETGCGAATSTTTGNVSTCAIRYGEATSYPQSTTGNISGVFDMSGGSMEYVMGNYNNTANSTYFAKLPESKYYDVYTITSNSSCNLTTCGGHALFETASWYSDSAGFVTSGGPWFGRGGSASNGSGPGTGVFSSSNYTGDASNIMGFRSVLVARGA